MIPWLASFAWLLLIWIALLGGVSPVGAVMGALLSAALLTYFKPLTGMGQALAFRPHHVISFLAFFGVLFVKANIQVALAVLNPARVRGRRGVVAVPIVDASELTTLVLANAVCLTPGTFVLEIRHSPATLYVHVLQLSTPRDLRLGILEMERRIVRAIGPAEAAGHVRTLMARVAADPLEEGRHVSWKPSP
jgi:multicomponent Na+:H+ antiporter subunit E